MHVTEKLTDRSNEPPYHVGYNARSNKSYEERLRVLGLTTLESGDTAIARRLDRDLQNSTWEGRYQGFFSVQFYTKVQF